MRIKEEMIVNLSLLGFKDASLFNNNEDCVCSYYDKYFGYGKYIRVGSPYTHSNVLEFHHSVGEWGDDEEITDYIPIWAFSTIIKMIQLGFIEED